jgi:O-acetyl-ADP-ribose deacetylase
VSRTPRNPEVIVGDITVLKVDAIVNAANEDLLPGGGVCGAIHAAAGPQLAKACRAVAPCPTGEARLTPGFHLPASYVIHAVGPVYDAGSNDSALLLASAYRSSLHLACNHHIASIAFPCISTGIYGYPLEDAAEIALSTIREFIDKQSPSPHVICCCFRNSDASVYRRLMKQS